MKVLNLKISITVFSLFLFLLLPAACAPAAAPAPAAQPVLPATQPAAQPTQAGMQPTQAGVPVTGSQAITVTETEYKLDMPSTVPSGQVTFHIVNNGTMPHNLEVEGQGVEQKLPANLTPGQSGDLTVNLTPGKYEVYCPVDGHKDLGMKLDLTVQ